MKSYRYNSHWIPQDFQRNFDAHIYFDQNDENIITNLQKDVRKSFPASDVFVGDIIPEPIGPHPKAMLEINFTHDFFKSVLFWLIKNRQHLSVLIHPLNGDDYWEHTQGVIWLGHSLELKLSAFKNPHLN